MGQDRFDRETHRACQVSHAQPSCMRCCFDGATGAAHHEMESVQVLSSIITVIFTIMVIIIIIIYYHYYWYDHSCCVHRSWLSGAVLNR